MGGQQVKQAQPTQELQLEQTEPMAVLEQPDSEQAASYKYKEELDEFDPIAGLGSQWTARYLAQLPNRNSNLGEGDNNGWNVADSAETASADNGARLSHYMAQQGQKQGQNQKQSPALVIPQNGRLSLAYLNAYLSAVYANKLLGQSGLNRFSASGSRWPGLRSILLPVEDSFAGSFMELDGNKIGQHLMPKLVGAHLADSLKLARNQNKPETFSKSQLITVFCLVGALLGAFFTVKVLMVKDKQFVRRRFGSGSSSSSALDETSDEDGKSFKPMSWLRAGFYTSSSATNAGQVVEKSGNKEANLKSANILSSNDNNNEKKPNNAKLDLDVEQQQQQQTASNCSFKNLDLLTQKLVALLSLKSMGKDFAGQEEAKRESLNCGQDESKVSFCIGLREAKFEHSTNLFLAPHE